MWAVCTVLVVNLAQVAESCYLILVYVFLLAFIVECIYIWTKLLHATDLFLYPLKTENQRFSDIFRGYRKRSVAWNWLNLKDNDRSIRSPATLADNLQPTQKNLHKKPAQVFFFWVLRNSDQLWDTASVSKLTRKITL